MSVSEFSREISLYICHLPKYLKSRVGRYIRTKKALKYREQILNDRNRILEVCPDAQNTLDYIQNSKEITVFNADFEKKCDPFKTPVFYDKDKKLKYVMVDGKRLYYPHDHSKRHIQYWFQSVCWEQSSDSPHRYLDDDNELDGAILFDCGCAEGNLTVKHIERLKKAYLFEGDKSWMDALEATFSHWKEKVSVVNGFLGVEEGMISLGRFIESRIENGDIDCENDKVFIKMDVEGAEPDLMKDLLRVLPRLKNVRLAVCVYHYQDEEKKVIESVPEGFSYRTRPGYMFFYSYEPEICFPYFRHGVVRIERKRTE